MKVEKISDFKVRITLSLDELKVRNISLLDLEKNSDKAKNLFLELISETELEHSFLLEQSQLYIEASSDNQNSFVVTITKIDDFTDLDNFDILDSDIIDDKKILYSKNLFSNIYIFETLDEIINCSKMIITNNFFNGKNTMYHNNNLYYLVFSKYSIKNIKFKSTNNVLSEYSKEQLYSLQLETLINENYNLIFENNAIKSLAAL